MKKGLLKKLFATTLVGAMAISMVACGGEDAGEKDALTKIKEKGELTVGMSVDYAPYEFFVMENGKKKMVGMDLEILKEVAKDIGVDFKVEEMEFKGICTAVQAGQVDMGLSGLSPDEKRRELVDFSDIYFEAEQGILINKKDASKIKKLEDLKGLKVGAQLGSIQADIANTIPDVKTKFLEEVPVLIQDLLAGNLDAVIVELPVADVQSVIHPELARAEEKVQDEAGGGSAIAVPKDQKALLDQINKTIKRLIDEEKIDSFYKDAVELSKSEVVGE
ncbi:MAG: transporter substrate-binding domain-containing protein [Clostridium sp.]|uniref:transporter substrate-binding domain-containing protein n=1 Tax=Clostridium sp. TaxID=1506 RepID=UPI0025BA4866|nr:transporter substrate-binding domain-containing protein [Clostridium sp.]MBS5926632.1 transporter substrate-binding domain-containing protein [Clostridium sp.]